MSSPSADIDRPAEDRPHRARRLPPSPALPGSELLLLAVGAIALAVAMFWPLALHLDTDLPKDLGDPLSQAWQLAWGAHAIVDQPLSFFQANQFWPLPDTLAFSDALVGYAPLDFPGRGVTAAIVRYNVIFLLASALAFAGPYLLARELGVRRLAAAVAGAAFAYAPWRLEQGGHLHILSSGGIALALFLLLRGYRRGAGDTGGAALVAAGWVVVAWQVAIGFSLGLPFLVALAAGGVLAAIVWWRRGRPALPRRLVTATVAGVAFVLVLCVVLGRPYLRVQHDHPQSQRSERTIATYSAGPAIFLASSELNPVWGRASDGVRDGLNAVPEQTLFPGLVVLLLAIAGALWPPWPRAVRIGLVAAVGVFAVLSLGFETAGVGRYLPYRLLYETIPGWSGMRVPERLNVFTSLALALLAAAGAARLLAALRQRDGVLASAAGVVLVALILAEGAGMTPGRWYPHPAAPPAPAGLAGLPAPLLQLPAGPQDNRRYLLWSADGLPKMVNGRSSLTPKATGAILRAATGFPDAASVARLRRLGVRTVVLHRTVTDGTLWEDWRERPVVGLGITRVVDGPLVVYELR